MGLYGNVAVDYDINPLYHPDADLQHTQKLIVLTIKL